MFFEGTEGVWPCGRSFSNKPCSKLCVKASQRNSLRAHSDLGTQAGFTIVPPCTYVSSQHLLEALLTYLFNKYSRGPCCLSAFMVGAGDVAPQKRGGASIQMASIMHQRNNGNKLHTDGLVLCTRQCFTAAY